MAINFAAANMAGYNNPKIEIFTAILTEEGTLDKFPNKSAILDCIKRGSVPFLMLTNADHTQMFIIPLNFITGEKDYAFSFCGCVNTGDAAIGSVLTVFYPINNDAPPMFKLETIPKNI